jgi:hypothetical protein
LAHARNSNAFLICQNVAFKFNCKILPQIKAKVRLLSCSAVQDSHYLSYKRFEKQEKVETKIGYGKKCALPSSKVRAALKKQTAGRSAKSYHELGWKIQVHHGTVKNYLTKMRVHRKAQKPPPKTIARQQSVIKASVKLLAQNFLSAKSIYKCVMDNESYWITSPSGNSKVNMSLKITQQQRMSSLFAKPSSQRRFCCGWRSVKAA